MVTSAIAIPALLAIRDNMANARYNFLCNDSTSMEMTPIKPEMREKLSSKEMHPAWRTNQETKT